MSKMPARLPPTSRCTVTAVTTNEIFGLDPLGHLGERVVDRPAELRLRQDPVELLAAGGCPSSTTA